MPLHLFKEGGWLQLPRKQLLNMRFLEFFVLLAEGSPVFPIKVLIIRHLQAAEFGRRPV